jgi:PHD/YefM family antitoxin component YafN of YafNO toxin-antitoxin module
MFKAEDICALSDFTRNARRHVERLRKTRRPEVLTLNGAAELVVQNAEAYQALLDRLDELETIRALDEAAAEIARGEVEPALAMMSQLRQQLGLRQRTQ